MKVEIHTERWWFSTSHSRIECCPSVVIVFLLEGAKYESPLVLFCYTFHIAAPPHIYGHGLLLLCSTDRILPLPSCVCVCVCSGGVNGQVCGSMSLHQYLPATVFISLQRWFATCEPHAATP